MARPKSSRRHLPPRHQETPEQIAAVRAELEDRLHLIRAHVEAKRLRGEGPSLTTWPPDETAS